MENELMAIYARHPFLTGYMSTMLEGLQLSENDEACVEEREPRDTGTIYTVPLETFGQALADCEAFLRLAGPVAVEAESFMGWESLGCDFHMTRVGHGAGYWDRKELDRAGAECDNLGRRLTEVAETLRNEGGYFGDDGRVYL